MKISQFYKEKQCPKLLQMEQFVGGSERRLHLKNVLDMVVGLIGAGTSYSDIRHTVSESLMSMYAKIVFDFPWQREQLVEQDFILFDRLLKWFEKYEYTVVKAVNSVSVTFENYTFSDGTNELHTMVPLVMQDKDGRFYGMIIHTNKSKRSKKGKKIDTKASCDLYALVAKYALESSYPGIEICSIYLPIKSDCEQMGEEFVETDKEETNVHRLSYEDYYENGTFNGTRFYKSILDVINFPMKRIECKNCFVNITCNVPRLHPCYEVKDDGGKYVLPESFTDEQQLVVCHVEGPMRVCAGPGSGKTTTLVGRIKYLIDKGVSPEFILVVTFTSKAAAELKERCLSFLSENNLPCICTLHSFGFTILKSCENLFDRPLKLLSEDGKMRLIENMLATRSELRGFNYNMLKGKNGLYDTVSNRLAFYFNCLRNGNERGFWEKYPQLGDDFVRFALEYDACIKEQGYISFDDMITLCNQLFEEHPEVLNVYQNVYKYIMVDEFQDVNQEQVDMIYSLAAKHHNLVVVGDDDQSIYSWRGGSSSFMLDFHKAFPELDEVVLSINFRSTKAIVEAARELIQHNHSRIAKDLKSGCKSDFNTPPTVIYSTETNAIETLIKELVEGGYQYEDIAIMACDNKTLEVLHKELGIPTILAKCYLNQDAFFLLLRSVLNLQKDLNDDGAFYQFLRLYGHDYRERVDGLSLSESLFAKYGVTLDNPGDDSPYCEVLSFLRDYLKVLAGTENCYKFIETLRTVAGWHHSDSPSVIAENARLRGVKNYEDLLDYLNALAEYGTDARVAEERGDKVLLITSYDAKGKEYKVALVVNDFQRDNEEECRNLFYVAITRGKEGVFIFQSKGQGKYTDYLPDMNHIVKEVLV